MIPPACPRLSFNNCYRCCCCIPSALDLYQLNALAKFISGIFPAFYSLRSWVCCCTMGLSFELFPCLFRLLLLGVSYRIFNKLKAENNLLSQKDHSLVPVCVCHLIEARRWRDGRLLGGDFILLYPSSILLGIN
jgi:hypothetical protein